MSEKSIFDVERAKFEGFGTYKLPIEERVNEIRIRRSMSVDVLKKRTPLQTIPKKSSTQREITIKSFSSMQTPVTMIRRKMSQTVISRTPQIKPPPIPPKALKPFLRRKENPK